MHCLWSFIVQLLLYWSLATSQVRSSTTGNGLSTGYVNLLPVLADQPDSNLLTPSASDLSSDLSSGTTIVTGLHVTNLFDRTNIICSDLTTNIANIVCSELTTNTANMVMSSSSSDIFKDISSQKVLKPSSTFESQRLEAVSSDIRNKPISMTVFSTVLNLKSASFQSSLFVFSDTIAAEPSKMSTEPIGSEINLVLATIEPNRSVVSSSGELGLATIEPSRAVVSSSGELGLATIEPSRAVVSSSSELGQATIEPSRAVVSSSGELGLATIEPSRAVVSSSGVLGLATIEPSRAVVSSSGELHLATIEPSRAVVSSSGELGLATIEPSRAVVSSSGELGLATIEPSRAVVSSSNELGLATIEPSRAVVSSSGVLGLATIEPSRAVVSSSSELGQATIEPSRAIVFSSGELHLATIEPSRAVVSSSGELGLATIEPSRAVVSSSSELGQATIEPSRAVVSSSRELKNTIYETSTFTVRSSGEDVLARTSIEPTLTSVSSSRKTDTPSMTLAEAFSVLSTFTAYTLDSQNRVLQDSLTLYETSMSDHFAEKTISTYSASLFHETMSFFSTIKNTILVSAEPPLFEKSASTALVENAPSISERSADLAESVYFSLASTKIGVLNTFHTSVSQDTANSVHSLLAMASLEISEIQGILTETVRPIEIHSSSVQSQALHSITFSNLSEASSHAGLPSVTHPITERTGHSELIDLLTSITMPSVDSYILYDSQVRPLSTVEFPKRSDAFNLETATNILTTVQSLEKMYSNFLVNDSAVLNLTSIGPILVGSTFQTSAVPVVNTSSAIFVTSSFKDVSSMNEISTGYSTVSSLRTASSEIKLDYSSLESSDLSYLDTIGIKTKPSILSSSVPLTKIVSSPVSTVLISDVMMITAFPSSTFSLLMMNTTYSAYKSMPSTLLAMVNTANADDMTISLHPTEVLYSSLSSVLMPSNTVERTTFPLSSEIVQPTSTMVLSSSPTSNNATVLSTNDTSVLLSTIFSTLESTLMSISKFIATSAVTMTTSHTIFPETTSNIDTIMSEITPSDLLTNSDTNNKSELTPSSVSGNSNTKHISENTYITHIISSSFITETGTLITTKAEDKTESLHSSTILFSTLSSVLSPSNTVEGTTFLLPSETIHPSTTILVFSSSNNSSFVSVLNTSYKLVLQSTVLSTLGSTSLPNSSFIVPSSFIAETGMLFTTNAEDKTVSLYSSTILFASLSSVSSPTNTVEGTTFILSSEMLLSSTKTNSSFVSVLNTNNTPVFLSTKFSNLESITVRNSSFILTPAVTMTTIHTTFPEPISSIHTIMSEITHSAVLGNSDTNNKSELTPSSVSDNTNTKYISENTYITHIVPLSVVTETGTLITTRDEIVSLHSSTLLFTSLSSVLSPSNTVEGTTSILPSEMILSSTKNNSSFVSVLNTNNTPVLLSTMFSTLESTSMSNSTFNLTPAVTMTTIHTTFPEPISSIHSIMSEITHAAVLGNSDTNNKSELTPSSVSDNTNTKHMSENTIIPHILPSSVITETGILFTTNAEDKTVSLHSSTILFASLSSVLMPTNTVEGTTFLLPSEMILSSTKNNSSFVSVLNTNDTPIVLSTMFSNLESITVRNSSFILTPAVTMTTIHTTFPEPISSIHTIMSEITHSAVFGNSDTNNKSELTPSSVSDNTNTKYISENTYITHIVPLSVVTETGTLITTRDETVSLHSSTLLFTSLSSVLSPSNTVVGTTSILPSEMILSSTKNNSSFVSVLNTNDTPVLLSTMLSNLESITMSNSSFILASSFITETGTLITTKAEDKTVSLHSSTILFLSLSSVFSPTNTFKEATFLLPSEMIHPSATILVFSSSNNSSFVSVLNTSYKLVLQSTVLSTLGSTSLPNSSFIVPSSFIAETGTLFTTNAEDKTASLYSSTILFASLSSVSSPTKPVEGTTFILPSEMILSSTKNISFVSVLNTSDIPVFLSTMFSNLESTSMSNSSFILTPAVTMTTIHTTFPEPISSIRHTIMSEITPSDLLTNSDTNNKSELTPSSVSGNSNTKHISKNTYITHIISSSFITETGTLITTKAEDKTESLHSSTTLFSTLSSVLSPSNTVEGTTFLLPSETIHPSTTILVFSSSNNSSFVSVLNTSYKLVLQSTVLSTLGSTSLPNSSFIVPSSFIAETGTLFTTNAEDKTVSLYSSTILFASLSSVSSPTKPVEGTTFILPSEMILSSTKNISFVSVLNTNNTPVLLSTMFSNLESITMSNSTFNLTPAVTMTTIHTTFPEPTSSIHTAMSEITHSAVLGNSDTNNKSELTPSSVSDNTNTKHISENTIITHIVPSSVITETGILFTSNAEDKTVSLHSSTILFSSLSSVLSTTKPVEGTTFILPSEMILSSTKNISFLSVLNTNDTPVLLSTMLSTFNLTPAVTMTTIHTTFPEPTMSFGTILSVIPPSNVSGNTKNMSEHTVVIPIVHSPVITETETGTRFLNSTLIAGLTTIGQMSTPSIMTTVTTATDYSPIMNVTSSASMETIMPSSVPETSTDFTNTTSLLTSAWSSLPQTSFLHTTDTEIFKSTSMTHVLTSYIVNLTPSFIASSALSSSLNVTLISTPLYTTAGITVMPTSVLMTQLITLISDTVTPEIFSTSASNNITVNVSDEATTLTTAVVFSNVTEVVFSNVTEVVFSNVTEVVSTNFSVTSTLAVSTFSMSFYNVSTTKMPTLSTTAATILSSLATSSAVLTTTVKPTTSTATIQPSKAPRNITEAGENYWVVTVLKVPKTKNISSPTFRSSIEAGLAAAYLQAYTRKEYIRLGVFDPLKKRRRKKRYIKAEDTAVHVQRITQDAGTSAVSVAYSVENNGSVVPAVDAVNTLALMDIQELAIILKEVVSTKAETYIKFVSPGSGTADAGGMAAWMIAAIAGGVAALIIIVFVVACCCFKCCHQQQKTDIKGQPQLVGLKTPLEEESEFVVTCADPEYLKEQPKQGSKASLLSQKSRKSQRYEVTQPRVQDETPVKKRDLSRSKTSSIFNSRSEDSMDKEAVEGNVISPSRRKNNRLKESDLLNDQTPGPEDSPVLFRNMSDEDEELKKKAEMERKLNKERIKERIRDRRRKEKSQGLVNGSIREEIDRILEAPAENGLPHVFVDSSREKKKKDKESGQSNEGFAMEEETLEEARKRMHKLLDESFSLVSPEASSLELRKAVRSLSPSSAHHESVKEELSDDDTAHTPMYVTPVTYSKPTLETWSPYRASDQVALISMPKSQQTTIKSATTQPQAKPLRRPVASFPEPNTVASQERKYTTSPPKPIVITSRELLKPSTLDEQKPVSALTLITGVSKGLKNPSLGKLSKTNIDENDTNLSQSDHLMTNGNAGSFEMKMLNNSQGKRRKHKRHGHEPRNYDEIDIITNNLKTGESTADYIRSIRKEIQHKPDRMDPQRKLRTSMTDIV